MPLLLGCFLHLVILTPGPQATPDDAPSPSIVRTRVAACGADDDGDTGESASPAVVVEYPNGTFSVGFPGD
jgi:hypothetical protein